MVDMSIHDVSGVVGWCLGAYSEVENTYVHRLHTFLHTGSGLYNPLQQTRIVSRPHIPYKTLQHSTVYTLQLLQFYSLQPLHHPSDCKRPVGGRARVALGGNIPRVEPTSRTALLPYHYVNVSQQIRAKSSITHDFWDPPARYRASFHARSKKPAPSDGRQGLLHPIGNVFVLCERIKDLQTFETYARAAERQNLAEHPEIDVELRWRALLPCLQSCVRRHWQRASTARRQSTLRVELNRKAASSSIFSAPMTSVLAT